MEFFGLLGVLLLIGSIFGWVSFFKLKGLENQLSQLKKELQLVRQSILNKQSRTEERPKSETIAPSPEIIATSIEQPVPAQDKDGPETVTSSSDQEIEASELKPEPQLAASQELEKTVKAKPKKSQFVDPDELLQKFKENWMLWTGGLSVALAGIFLARYAIQHGVLGPTGRIVAGIISGVSLHLAAEYFRRKLNNNHPTFAMLAAGGSIGLFATLLASLHFYQMISPTVVFVILAIVAVCTMWLSLIHGPILAGVGMIGAYVLPLMVSTGSGNIIVALTYSLIITGSILLLLQYVNRIWLWQGMLAGSLFWWAASLERSSGDVWREWYLAILAYGLISVVNRDWFLARLQPFLGKDRFYHIYSKQLPETERWLAISLILIVIAQQFSVLATSSIDFYFPAWIPLAAVVMLAARNNAYLSIHAWIALIGVVGTILYIQFDKDYSSVIEPIQVVSQSDFLTNMILYTVVFSGLAFYNSRDGVLKSCWTAMTLITPILAMITTYLCVPSLMSDGYWTMSGLIVGALYIFLATTAKARSWDKAWEIWLYLSGHFAYSFAAASYFENGTLTLALAAQTLSLSLIIKRYDVPQLGWLLKLVVTITLLRLSANPWLIDYSTTNHWTIWTYGGSFLAVFGAGYLLANYAKLRKWTEGAAMHLLVLTIWIECRYYLYDGAVFNSEYTFTEAALTTLIFGALALVYYYRASLGRSSQKIYRYYSYLLMILALGNYGIIVIATLDGDSAIWKNISETPIWNIMLIAYGFPVVLAALAVKYFEPRLSKYFEYLAGLAAFLFINLEIRHLWQGSLNLSLKTSDGEFYTYSIFWLFAAIAMIFAGSYRLGRRYYKLGLSMLAMVVVKVFIFDMSQLDGIYRILAFMGLGLSLLGMAYIHKKLAKVLDDRELHNQQVQAASTSNLN